ncbi:glycosyltransferase [Providencia heimbachae]|uniref:glycosyltransferase n=1 Tax=Providencia heimbachae TaxID=333962 RepID=UPI001C309282|nr:glycosyltransferase [Providencia heimbachae]
MNLSNLAPVVLFVYARPSHTQRTVDALLLNPDALSTDLIVYSDGARNDSDTEAVNQVRNIFKGINGFNSIKLIERKKNYGLAQNIIDGVTEVCNEYGKVIVLEDDIVTSPSFLNFMNAALNKYEKEKKVWHISGWNYPLKNVEKLPDAFFWRTMNCWGWATWDDRWKYFEKKTKKNH